MIRKFFATVLAVATAGLLSADSNLFRNTEFADGGADWLVMRAKALEKTPVVWGKGSFSVDLPLAKEMRNGRLQLVQRIRLEKAKEYVLTFTSELEKSATILVSYRTDTNPKRNLGIANSLTLPAGKRDWTLIVSPAESGNDRSEFCFQIGEIAGKVTLSDLRLQEFRQVPLQLADRWKLVRTDSPDFERIPAGAETIRRPTDATVGKSNRIDLVRKGERVVENSSAVLYNEFESDQEGFMRTGFSLIKPVIIIPFGIIFLNMLKAKPVILLKTAVFRSTIFSGFVTTGMVTLAGGILGLRSKIFTASFGRLFHIRTIFSCKTIGVMYTNLYLRAIVNCSKEL